MKGSGCGEFIRKSASCRANSSCFHTRSGPPVNAFSPSASPQLVASWPLPRFSVLSRDPSAGAERALVNAALQKSVILRAWKLPEILDDVQVAVAGFVGGEQQPASVRRNIEAFRARAEWMTRRSNIVLCVTLTVDTGSSPSVLDGDRQPGLGGHAADICNDWLVAVGKRRDYHAKLV